MLGWTFLLFGQSVCLCPGRDTHVNLRCSGCVYVCLSREQELAVLGVCFQYMFMFVCVCLLARYECGVPVLSGKRNEQSYKACVPETA